MPKNKRQAIKEKVDQVIGKVERSRDELVGLANIYHDTHEDYCNVFMTLANHLDKAVKPLTETRDAI